MKPLPEFVEGMKIGDSKIECCEICELKNSKKKPVPKDCMTRAKKISDIVHTDVLGKIPPEDVDGHCYTIRFVESFSRFSKFYFMKTRDEILDKLNSFVYVKNMLWHSALEKTPFEMFTKKNLIYLLANFLVELH